MARLRTIAYPFILQPVPINSRSSKKINKKRRLSPDKKDGRYSEVAYVGTWADKMNDDIRGMNELLKDMPENNTLLQNARQGIKQDIATERIIQVGIIYNYLAEQKLGLDYDYRRQVNEIAGKINFADIQKIHDDNLKGNLTSTVYWGRNRRSLLKY